ncbi:MAG TPA: hypothetical protein VEG35_04555, partial [Burkholderiales bacterium]|nr:hypothetical protein [Burkholderiales bacterium]
NSFSLGVGYVKGGLHLDVGVEYLIAQKRTVAAAYDELDNPTNLPGLYKMHMPVPFFSLSYAF